MASGMPVIILVHGLGLKEGEQTESDKWKEALGRALSDTPGSSAAPLRMVYYSDELHPEVRRITGATNGGPRRFRPSAETATPATAEPASASEEGEELLLQELLRRYMEYDTQQRLETARRSRLSRSRD